MSNSIEKQASDERITNLLRSLHRLEENGISQKGIASAISALNLKDNENVLSFFDANASLSLSDFKDSKDISGKLFSFHAKTLNLINFQEPNKKDTILLNVNELNIDENSKLTCKTVFICTSHHTVSATHDGSISDEVLNNLEHIKQSLKGAGAEKIVFLAKDASRVITDLMQEVDNRDKAYIKEVSNESDFETLYSQKSFFWFW